MSVWGEWVCLHVCAHVEAGGCHPVSSSSFSLHFIIWGGLGSSCLCTLRTGARRFTLQCLAFTWALGIRTKVLRIELWTHHPPSHPPPPLLPLEPCVSGFVWRVLWGKTFFTMRASEILLSCHCSFCRVVFHYLNELLCVSARSLASALFSVWGCYE